jgi:hypothetical protein
MFDRSICLALLCLLMSANRGEAAVPAESVVVRNVTAPDVCLTPGGASERVLLTGINLDQIRDAQVLLDGNPVSGIVVSLGRAETRVRELRLRARRNVGDYASLELAVVGPGQLEQTIPVRVHVQRQWSPGQCAALASNRSGAIRPESLYPGPTLAG